MLPDDWIMMKKQIDGDVNMAIGAGNSQESERQEERLDIVKKGDIEFEINIDDQETMAVVACSGQAVGPGMEVGSRDINTGPE